MGLQGYVRGRLLQLPLLLFGLATVLFLLTRAMPGDPARLALGPEATKEQIENLRHIWGLDQPPYIQYFMYVRGLVWGDWGKSLFTMNYVKDDIFRFLPATIELAVVGMTFAVALGLFTGVFAAHHKDAWPDHLSRFFSLAGVSLPRFWTGIMLQIVVGFWLQLLPITGRIARHIQPPTHVTGLYIFDSLVTLNWTAFHSSLLHIFLPAVTYSFGVIANISRLTRSSMIDEATKDYVTAARANGLPETLVVYVYMFKNSFLPALTIITLAFAHSLSGSILVESVFNWPGMGLYLVSAISFTDINAIVASSIIVGLAVILANLVTDVLYAYIDPRIRYAERALR